MVEYFAKFIGAVIGGLISLSFTKEKSGKFGWVKQLLVSIACGFVSASFLVIKLDVEPNIDMLIFAGTVCAVFSFALLKIVLEEGFLKKIAENYLAGKKSENKKDESEKGDKK